MMIGASDILNVSILNVEFYGHELYGYRSRMVFRFR